MGESWILYLFLEYENFGCGILKCDLSVILTDWKILMGKLHGSENLKDKFSGVNILKDKLAGYKIFCCELFKYTNFEE